MSQKQSPPRPLTKKQEQEKKGTREEKTGDGTKNWLRTEVRGLTNIELVPKNVTLHTIRNRMYRSYTNLSIVNAANCLLSLVLPKPMPCMMEKI